ncbi:MAG TPA: ATP-binding protein [Gemmataceae bacterium]|nr:ATP-binding protein [Gemmataceae bacterium]
MHHYGKEQRERAAMIDLGTHESTRRVVLRSLGEVRPLAEALENWMRVLGFPRKDIFAVKLALGEAVVNAFRHGNLGDPSKVVRVNYVVTLAEVFIEVDDDGPGFDPNQVPDPLAAANSERMSGRGLFLMRVYMSGVSFNPQGNRVTLWRRRSGA